MVFCECLMVKTVICFPNVAQIATYVYKIRVYTSCLTGAEELGTLMVYYFPKWCIFKTVDTIKGPPQDRVFLIWHQWSKLRPVQVEHLFLWISLFIHFKTYISKLPCFVVTFRYGSGHCLSGPWFCCGYQQKLHSHCYFISLSVGDGFFLLFLSTAVFLQCAWISSNVCLVRPLVVCHILYKFCFHWFELLQIMFFGFRIISLGRGVMAPLLLSVEHYNMWLLHCFCLLVHRPLGLCGTGENYLPLL